MLMQPHGVKPMMTRNTTRLSSPKSAAIEYLSLTHWPSPAGAAAAGQRNRRGDRIQRRSSVRFFPHPLLAMANALNSKTQPPRSGVQGKAVSEMRVGLSQSVDRDRLQIGWSCGG